MVFVFVLFVIALCHLCDLCMGHFCFVLFVLLVYVLSCGENLWDRLGQARKTGPQHRRPANSLVHKTQITQL